MWKLNEFNWIEASFKPSEETNVINRQIIQNKITRTKINLKRRFIITTQSKERNITKSLYQNNVNLKKKSFSFTEGLIKESRCMQFNEWHSQQSKETCDVWADLAGIDYISQRLDVRNLPFLDRRSERRYNLRFNNSLWDRSGQTLGLETKISSFKYEQSIVSSGDPATACPFNLQRHDPVSLRCHQPRCASPKNDQRHCNFSHNAITFFVMIYDVCAWCASWFCSVAKSVTV